MGPAVVDADDNTGHWANRQATWRVVIDRIASGDSEAMAQLYGETSPVVYSVALRMLGNASDAEEATLDVYTQIWRTAHRYSGQRGTVAAWIMNITRSRAIDLIRSRAARSRSGGPLENVDAIRDPAHTPDRLSEIGQQSVHLRAALGGLPPEQRQCIELAFFGGLTHAELARRLGEPLGTVKTRIRSGMLRLKAALGGL